MYTGSDVVVVEDDKDIRDSVVEILREEGYDARGFSNGAEALQYLRSGVSTRVILLDVMMPVMDGWEFRVELEKETALANIPVILLTADGNAKRKALTMRAVDGLTKPVRLDELLATVQRYCPPKPSG